MKRGWVVISVIVIAVAALIVIYANPDQFTGRATLTSGANYGPIQTTSYVYHSCVYLTENDGWDVTKTTKVRYFDRLEGLTKEAADYCENDNKVREYNCQKGYMVYRPVVCPSNMVCKEGSCVYK